MTLALLALTLIASTTPPAAPLSELSPFSRTDSGRIPLALRTSVAEIHVDETAWLSHRDAKTVRMTAVPLGPNRTVELQLRRIDPFAPDARIVEASVGPDGALNEREIPRPIADYFVGTIAGKPNSRAMISHIEGGLNGFVSDGEGTYILTSGLPGTNQPVVSYKTADLPEGILKARPWSCGALVPPGAEPLDTTAPSEGGVAEDLPCRQVQIAVDTDQEFRSQFIGILQNAGVYVTTDTVTNYAAWYAGTLLAGTSEIYQWDLNFRTQVSFLRLWVSGADPWDGSSTLAQLNQFRDYWQANMSDVPRHTAHFLSGRNLGGGIAWIAALCTNWAYGLSADLDGAFPYPLVDHASTNWDLVVVAHEIGHNCGAPHTHDYCPPADNCADEDYFGVCQTYQNCTANGTLMSYCHLCGAGISNIGLHFHPWSVNSIADYLSARLVCPLLGSALPPAGDPDTAMVGNLMNWNLDVTANDIHVNCDAFHIYDFDQQTAQGASLALLAGAGPGGRDLLRFNQPRAITGSDQFSYRVQDSSGQVSDPIVVMLDVHHFHDASTPKGDTAGLSVAYYALPTSIDTIPDFEALTPYLTTTYPSPYMLAATGTVLNSTLSDYVGGRFTGWLRVDQDGFYNVEVSWNDGGRMVVDSEEVALDTTISTSTGLTRIQGVVGLRAGKHALQFDFFEKTSIAGMTIKMWGPGMSYSYLSPDRLTHGGTLQLQPGYDLNLDGQVDGADLGLFLGQWQTDGPADFDHNGVVDGADLGLLLGSWGPVR